MKLNTRFLTTVKALAFAALASAAMAQNTTKKIALYDDLGSGGAGIPSVQMILTKAGINLTTLTAEQIRNGELSKYDVVIFTGGSGSKQAEALQTAGVDEVRKFVQAGGGYIGICAGAYLACDRFSWSAKMLNARTVSQKWKRGKANVEIELTDEGKKILGDVDGKMLVKYANGPIITSADNKDMPEFTPLAYFRTEVAENDTPVGVMENSPAVVASTFGKGKLITFSPHPEQTDGLHDLITHAVNWVATPSADVAGAQ
ncbi:biofilm PGA synthesis protein PgaB [Spartobacteria bacterium LR76]|nr:biofilm PGA synthesis protein PgaB [Spartobacteria bacterium LR76]